MTPRQRSAILWGVVGVLAFLVLAQAARLLAGWGVALPALLASTIVVWATATVASYWLDGRLVGKRRV